jgi:hypothetical protein
VLLAGVSPSAPCSARRWKYQGRDPVSVWTCYAAESWGCSAVVAAACSDTGEQLSAHAELLAPLDQASRARRLIGAMQETCRTEGSSTVRRACRQGRTGPFGVTGG